MSCVTARSPAAGLAIKKARHPARARRDFTTSGRRQPLCAGAAALSFAMAFRKSFTVKVFNID